MGKGTPGRLRQAVTTIDAPRALGLHAAHRTGPATTFSWDQHGEETAREVIRCYDCDVTLGVDDLAGS